MVDVSPSLDAPLLSLATMVHALQPAQSVLQPATEDVSEAVHQELSTLDLYATRLAHSKPKTLLTTLASQLALQELH